MSSKITNRRQLNTDSDDYRARVLRGSRVHRRRISKKKVIEKLVIPAVIAIIAAVASYLYIDNAISELNKPTLTEDVSTYTYVVKEGDTIWDIANKVSTSKDNVNRVAYYITRDNDRDKNTTITPGELLKIRYSYSNLW